MTNAVDQHVELPEAVDELAGSTSQSLFSRWPGTGLDLVACLSAAGFLLVFFQPMAQPSLSPRRAMLLALLPVALVLLGRMVRARDRAAILAVAFLLWAFAVSVTSAAPWASVVGSYQRHHSVLALIAIAGMWAIGRHLSRFGAWAVAWVLVGACGINLAVALIQIVVQPTNSYLALDFGRPAGLVMSPVYLGALACGAAAFFAYRFGQTDRRADLVAFVLASVLSGVSGSRISLLTVILLACWAGFRTRGRLRWLLLPSVATGAIAAAVALRVLGSSQSAGERATSAGGVQDRLDIWSYGLRGWIERPLTGWGVGRFRSASQAHFSDDWARRFPIAGWLDAHNVVVEYLATVGLVGLALLVAFVVTCAFHSRGPCAWMASAIAITWLFEPASLVTLPVAALLLGAACVGHDAYSPRRDRPATLVAAGLIGVVLASWYSIADFQLLTTTSAEETSTAADMSVWFRFDAAAASQVAAAKSDPLATNGSGPLEAILWSERATDLEPDNPAKWSALATRLLRDGQVAEAQRLAERALELQPTFPSAWQVLEVVAMRTNDADLEVLARQRACDFDRPTCVHDVAEADG